MMKKEINDDRNDLQHISSTKPWQPPKLEVLEARDITNGTLGLSENNNSCNALCYS